MYYVIENTLRECTGPEARSGKKKQQYVAVLSPQEWQASREDFELGIDMDIDAFDVHTTKAEVNYDSVTGTFAIPDRKNIFGEYQKFAFALDEKGIVFIDPGDTVTRLIKKIVDTKKWRFPSLERFIYDFLEAIIHEDLPLLERYERELDTIDRDIDNDSDPDITRLNDIRCELRDLRIHYDHLIDLAQELEENENSFFKSENIRFFRLFSNRVSRLFDLVNSLLDYAGQIRDTYESRLDVRQNRIMTVLTVVTAIFMPLTLIAGWYGMNFKYMPELDSVWGYPAVILVSILIVVFCLIFFKRKKWM
ncbi:MAG: magnesium transporter CorA [Lachnospiraceae bacterium]|nr:magnesium transporter CorA [Lachnospiraceae bacterium]